MRLGVGRRCLDALIVDELGIMGGIGGGSRESYFRLCDVCCGFKMSMGRI